MTVPKMAKKTGGMAPKRKMKGGEPETIKVGDQEYTVTVEGSKVCVEPKEGAAPAPAEGENKEAAAPGAPTEGGPDAAVDGGPEAAVDGGPEAADGASFGGKKRKSNKRTQKKKGKKPRKSAKKAKK